MQQISNPKPDIRIFMSGLIDISSRLYKVLGMDQHSGITFHVDDENNLYIRKAESEEEGLKPTSIHGKHHLRFHSSSTTRRILSLPDIPKGITTARFRVGISDDGIHFPIITRRIY